MRRSCSWLFGASVAVVATLSLGICVLEARAECGQGCKQILVIGWQDAFGVDFCRELESSDCVNCGGDARFCVKPLESVKTNCDWDTTIPYRSRPCNTECKLQCLADTTGNQEATCKSSGGNWTTFGWIKVCKQPKSP